MRVFFKSLNLFCWLHSIKPHAMLWSIRIHIVYFENVLEHYDMFLPYPPLLITRLERLKGVFSWFLQQIRGFILILKLFDSDQFPQYLPHPMLFRHFTMNKYSTLHMWTRTFNMILQMKLEVSFVEPYWGTWLNIQTLLAYVWWTAVTEGKREVLTGQTCLYDIY